MAVCSQCKGETPDITTFCVNCGNKMPVSAAQQTQFGMPLLRGPATASERSSGPATTQFGPDEIAALAAAAKESGFGEPEPIRPSLMAGLPRPPVSSAPSPLTASVGLKGPVTPRPMPSFGPRPVSPNQPAAQPNPANQATLVSQAALAVPASRRTVMGMPLMGASAPPAPAPDEGVGGRSLTPPAESGIAPPIAGAAAILSMDSLVNDLLAAPGPSAQSAPRPTADVARTPPAANAEAAVAVTRRPAGDLSAEATEPVMSSTPSAPAVRAPSARAAGASRPAEDTAEVIAVEVPRKSALPFVLIGLILVVATIAVVVFRD